MIYICATHHSLQSLAHNSQSQAFSESILSNKRADFKSKIEEFIKENKIDAVYEEIGEELCDQNNKPVISFCQEICGNHKIDYEFIETLAERKDNNTTCVDELRRANEIGAEGTPLGQDPSKLAAKEIHDKREVAWVSRLKASFAKNILAVIGSSHTESFSKKLEREGFHVEILYCAFIT